MKTELVLTFIGDDKPGLVEMISRIISDHEGNWSESRLSQLAGKFAGIVAVSVPEGRADDLVAALSKRTDGPGLTFVVERGLAGTATEDRRTHQLTLLGLDRPGIVRDVSRALAAQQINVLEFNTDIVPAAMTGEPMFDATAIVELSAHTDLEALTAQLASISAELGVDIEFTEE